MKFIILKDGAGNQVPILFSETLNHEEVARAMMKDPLGPVYEVVDAGKVSFYADSRYEIDGELKVSVSHGSITLPQVKPDEKQQKMTEVYLKVLARN